MRRAGDIIVTVVITHRPNEGAIHALLNNANGGVARDMMRRGIRVQTRARELITQYGAVDTGRLRSSLNVRQQVTSRGVVTTVGSNLKYAIYVHQGRRAGARMPPSSALTVWARRHGAPGQEFVIARAIARRGIPAKPFLKNALPAAGR
jgi:hypothetical protein